MEAGYIKKPLPEYIKGRRFERIMNELNKQEKMNFRKQKRVRTSIRVNDSMVGETIEMKVERIVNNKEPITDGAPIIFTERKDGVIPAYNPRTDRWEVAIDAMEAVSKANTAKREASIEARKKKEDGGTESIQGQAGQNGGQTTE